MEFVANKLTMEHRFKRGSLPNVWAHRDIGIQRPEFKRERSTSLSDYDNIESPKELYDSRRVSLPVYASTGRKYGPKPRSIKDVFKLYQAKIGFENGFDSSRLQFLWKPVQEQDNLEEVDSFPEQIGRRFIPKSRQKRSYSVREVGNIPFRNSEWSSVTSGSDEMRNISDIYRRFSAPTVNKPFPVKTLNKGTRPRRSIKDVFKLYQAKVGFLHGFAQETATDEDPVGVSYEPQLEDIDVEEYSPNEDTNHSEANLSDYMESSALDQDASNRDEEESDVYSPLIEHVHNSPSPFSEHAQEKEVISLSPWKPPSPYGYGNYSGYPGRQGEYLFILSRSTRTLSIV